MNEPQKEIQLTTEQKTYILANASTKSLLELTREIFGNPNLDGRSFEGRAVKVFLAGEQLPIKTTAHVGTGKIVLTDAQKKQIEDLAHSMTSLEVARLVFNNPGIKQLSQEWRAVHQHYKTCYPEGIDASEDPVDENDYKPPVSTQTLTAQVNEFVPTGDVNKKLYQWPLKSSDERHIRALMSYMRVLKFKYQATQYQRNVDRMLFISTFMRFTHDKPDLSAEEQDQYISAAAETVNIARIERDLMRIEHNIEEIMDGDRESRGQFMPMVELINATRSKLDQSKGRLKTLIEGLVTSRSDRIKDRDNRNSSIINLFDAWLRDKQRRDDMCDMGSKEKEEDVKEVNRIKELDDMSVIISGMTEEEAGLG